LIFKVLISTILNIYYKGDFLGMTENQASNTAQVTEAKNSDKELNFRALETKYRKELEQERNSRLEAEKQLQEVQSKRNYVEDDSDDDEPYVGHKKLEKRFSSFERKMEEKIDKKAEEKARILLDRKDEDDWIRNNNDFDIVLSEDNLSRLVNRAPGLADSIKRMPDGFEKQKLVYNTIKSMGIDKPDMKQPSIQDKIDANKRSPYYQPSGVGSSPYSSSGDFSASGQKNAYDKMKELQARLRI
jgi:hypothetical protein